MTAPAPKLAYKPREVSEMTGIPYKRVLELIGEGRLKAIKIRQHYVITVAALGDFLQMKVPVNETRRD